MKNEKFLLDIQTKCGNIANEILNVAIDAERTFKCKWPYLVYLRICICLRNKPWSDLSIKFNQYIINLSRMHWWVLIIFEFIQFLTQSLIECLCLKYLRHPSKCRVELVAREVSFFLQFQRKLYVLFFSFFFDLFQNSVYSTCLPQF